MNNQPLPIPGLRFHHVGLLVESIEEALTHYSRVFGSESVSPVFSISSQKVKVCFVRIGEEQFIELVEPIGEESVVWNLLKKKAGYYHMAYMVDHLQSTVEQLESLHYKSLEFFRSEAFPGKECVFLYTPEAHLIELIGPSF